MQALKERIAELNRKHEENIAKLTLKHEIEMLILEKTGRKSLIVLHETSTLDYASVSINPVKGENPIDMTLEVMESLQDYRLPIVHARGTYGHMRPLAYIGEPVNVLTDGIECCYCTSPDNKLAAVKFYAEIGKHALAIVCNWGLQPALEVRCVRDKTTGQKYLESPEILNVFGAHNPKRFGELSYASLYYTMRKDYTEVLEKLRPGVEVSPF